LLGQIMQGIAGVDGVARSNQQIGFVCRCSGKDQPGAWASLAGLFQLITGVRRWKSYGAQWAMILSGAQSVLAGVFMLKQAAGPDVVGIANIAPYAAFGAFYFLISAVSLTISGVRRRSKPVAA
jgi:apolipoprotein N-acyltransferase